MKTVPAEIGNLKSLKFRNLQKRLGSLPFSFSSQDTIEQKTILLKM